MVHRISLGIQKTEPSSPDPQFPSAMSSQPEYQQQMGSSTGPSPAVTLSSQVMVAAVIFLFAVVAFVVFLFLYAKHFWGPGRALRRSLSRARFVFADDPAHLVRRGLDAAVLRSLPVTIFQSVDFKEGGLECSVCLTELSDGEEARLLPKCNHGFHRECIDMWFHSHSTCPLCRCTVAPVPSESAHPDTMEALPREAISISTESLLLPTNVLFWGTQDLVSTRELAAQQEPAPSSSSSSSAKPEGMLVIEIPRRVVEGFGSPLPTSRFPGEEMKTPPSTRLRSLRRLLSRGKRTVGSSCSCSPSPRGGDIEQGGGRASLGEGSSLAPRTPTTS